MDDIYFIRHNFNNDKVLWEHCKANNCIAIHFNREGYYDFEQYSIENQKPNFRKAFGNLKTLALEGGRIVAQFEPNSFQIGVVKPGTPIIFHNYPDGNPLQDNFYKTLGVTEMSKTFYYADYPLLSALRPLYQTIAKMSPIVSNMFDHLLTGRPLDFTVNNMHPKMLELMCEEYLRSDLCPPAFNIQFSLVRTGETLPVVDVYAVTKNNRYLCMQITHATDPKTVKRKAEKLKEYINEVSAIKEMVGVFAGPARHEEVVKGIGLSFLAIEAIFAQLAKSDNYNWMLRELIGIRNQQSHDMT